MSLTRKEIREAIIPNIIDLFTLANGYAIEPASVKHGVINPQEVKQFPTLCLYIGQEPIETEYIDGTKEIHRNVTIQVVGYNNSEDDMETLAFEFQKFLYSDDFVYSDCNVSFDTNGVTYASDGVSSKVGLTMFDFIFYFDFIQDLTK